MEDTLPSTASLAAVLTIAAALFTLLIGAWWSRRREARAGLGRIEFPRTLYATVVALLLLCFAWLMVANNS